MVDFAVSAVLSSILLFAIWHHLRHRLASMPGLRRAPGRLLDRLLPKVVIPGHPAKQPEAQECDSGK